MTIVLRDKMTVQCMPCQYKPIFYVQRLKNTATMGFLTLIDMNSTVCMLSGQGHCLRSWNISKYNQVPGGQSQVGGYPGEFPAHIYEYLQGAIMKPYK